MIRNITTNDKISVSLYLADKLKISLLEASVKTKKIIKSGLPSFILESKDLRGLCYVELQMIKGVKEKVVVILCDNWRLAEEYLKILRWNLDGIYWFSLPKHDFLNRTLNKNGVRFSHVDNDKNIYCYRFEKRVFQNYKSEDNEE